MFAKAYLNISDEKLIERFNTDWGLQLFCGKLLSDHQRIRDKAIVSRVRSYLAEHTDWQQLQGVLINHWKRDMNNTHVLLMDATCYENYIRFPTDVKLLWESCRWVFEKNCLSGVNGYRLKGPGANMWSRSASNGIMTACAGKLINKQESAAKPCFICLKKD